MVVGDLAVSGLTFCMVYIPVGLFQLIADRKVVVWSWPSRTASFGRLMLYFLLQSLFHIK